MRRPPWARGETDWRIRMTPLRSFARHSGDLAFRKTRSQTISVSATAMRPNAPPVITLATRSSAIPLAPPAKDAARAMKKHRKPKTTI